MARRDVRTTLLATTAGLAIALAGIGPAFAAVDEPDQTLTVAGTLVNLMVEPTEGSVEPSGDAEVETFLEVDGQLLEMPEGLPLAAGVTGDDVTVTIEADADLDVAEALEIASAPEAAVDAGVEGDARIVEVAAVGAAGETELSASVLAAGALGTHTLTVLPVHWAGTDGTTTATLRNLATSTAQYWSEQSAGRIAVQTQVREWAAIADPGSCDPNVIFSRALAAHGVAAPTAGQHVLVYFPARSDCGGWAGLASIGGGYVWVNGAPNADVFAHEFGHNLGLGHADKATCYSGGYRIALANPLSSACTLNVYGDRADVMGIATSSATGNLNTALADYLGLATVSRASANAVTTVDLAPLASTTALRSVSIQLSSTDSIYVDFRPATGRDVRMPAWAGVQVHYRTLNATYGYPTTYLLDMKAPSTATFSSVALPVGAAWAVPNTNLVVSVASVGSTARVSVGPGTASISPAQAVLERYVSNVYTDLFGRGVDPTGLAGWTGALAAGTPRIAVANAITYSREYRARLITDSYNQFLGRGPDPKGLEDWIGAMTSGVTIQQMEAGFLASPEYYTKAGGTDSGWIVRLYQHVLGRGPSTADIQAWAAAIRASGRQQVAMGFLMSTEHLSEVVNDQYLHLLSRGLDPAGRQGWVTAIQSGHRLEAVIGGIIASDEYLRQG